MSKDEQTPDDAPVEDASVEQIHAAEPEPGHGVAPSTPAGGARPSTTESGYPSPGDGPPFPTAPGATGDAPDPSAITDPDELRAQIEETRGELGDTVEALSHKLDVKARASEAVDERKQAAKDTVAHAKDAIAETAGRAQAKVGEVASSAQAKVADATSSAHEGAAGATSAAQERAAGAASGAREATGQATAKARENPVPLGAVAVVAVVVLVVVWRRSR